MKCLHFETRSSELLSDSLMQNYNSLNYRQFILNNFQLNSNSNINSQILLSVYKDKRSNRKDKVSNFTKVRDYFSIHEQHSYLKYIYPLRLDQVILVICKLPLGIVSALLK